MHLDIRLPLGLMFASIGVVLVVTGLSSRMAVTIYSGVGVGIFGLLCLFLAWRARGRGRVS